MGGSWEIGKSKNHFSNWGHGGKKSIQAVDRFLKTRTSTKKALSQGGNYFDLSRGKDV